MPWLYECSAAHELLVAVAADLQTLIQRLRSKRFSQVMVLDLHQGKQNPGKSTQNHSLS